MKLVVNRVTEQEGKQTLGDMVLYDEGLVLFECKTLELPWRGNRQNVSCIPPESGEATYPFIILDRSPSFNYKHLWIKDVPNRSHIKVHRGNYHRSIEGCILVGDSFTDIDGDGLLDVTNSKRTLDDLIFQLEEIIGVVEGEIVIHSS